MIGYLAASIGHLLLFLALLGLIVWLFVTGIIRYTENRTAAATGEERPHKPRYLLWALPFLGLVVIL